jgi:hypothetical protein
MRVQDCTFEQRLLSDLPTTGDIVSWLADFDGGDQWYEGSPVTKAAVVLGDHIIMWQDKPLTDEDKRDAVAEYKDSVDADAERDEDGCYADDWCVEDVTRSEWQRTGF